MGSAQDVRETVAAFLASKQAAELVDPELAGALVTVFADVAALSDRTAVGFGPISLGGYLLDEFAETIELTEDEAMLVPAVLTAWAEFTNERRGLGEEGLKLWREALPDLTRAFTQVYLDDEVAELREEYEAIPVRDYKINAGMALSEVFQQLVDEARGGEGGDAGDEDDEYEFDEIDSGDSDDEE